MRFAVRRVGRGLTLLDRGRAQNEGPGEKGKKIPALSVALSIIQEVSSR
jgi:hypothetical protein